jgi:cobyrinic acid a,c-diamide synthase
LGLIQAKELEELVGKIDRIADLLEQHFDMERLRQLTQIESTDHVRHLEAYPNLEGLKLGVASDKAFRFYYKANLDLLAESSAELIYFSPLQDAHIPNGVNALYLGGGYEKIINLWTRHVPMK